MPYYNQNVVLAPPVKLLVAGHPDYLFGFINAYGQGNEDVPLSRMQVTQVSGNGTTATLTVTVLEGNIPNVGDLVSVAGLRNSGFDTNSSALTAVSITASTGQGTIQYSNGTSLGASPDAGTATSIPAEVGDTLAIGNSIPVTVQFSDPETNIGRTLSLVVTTPTNTMTTTFPTANVQGALRNVNSDYVNINPTADITFNGTAGAVFNATVSIKDYRFYRLAIQGSIGGGAATVVAKIM